MAFGRFENALAVIEKAMNVDLRSAEVVILHTNIRMVGKAHAHGNELFRSKRYTEACIAFRVILQIRFSTTIEQHAGIKLKSGKNLWMITTMLSISSHIILKHFFREMA
ncbi:hypothetical protein P3S67_015652 [Capsicum chacoense]